ncbi:hypothetical protein [Bacillus haynesii]|uniref:hypothetical protein n=1 Tax=Bacillus haynesii TaxID=1925021 RepID=UPI00227E8084|nr:hypothetical protein [Bacillus haynesii]MCY7861842.1 hypothetical protein [Bacillus haynesii]MCY8000702.1 hypothetical protein [Bacillus haynesii]MCY8003449.1 hypothetical protein [Bacillus haynesii]MCY8384308.1 hypothetical protein [Bacillus haynesii]MEC0700938.1 hypothetical protein [Bacillus haynesii]
MKNEKNFLYKKINEALIIFTIFFPVAGIFFVIGTIWCLWKQAPSQIPLFVSFISSIYFVLPFLLHIFRKKVWLKKYMQNYKNSEG